MSVNNSVPGNNNKAFRGTNQTVQKAKLNGSVPVTEKRYDKVFHYRMQNETSFSMKSQVQVQVQVQVHLFTLFNYNTTTIKDKKRSKQQS